MIAAHLVLHVWRDMSPSGRLLGMMWSNPRYKVTEFDVAKNLAEERAESEVVCMCRVRLVGGGCFKVGVTLRQTLFGLKGSTSRKNGLQCTSGKHCSSGMKISRRGVSGLPNYQDYFFLIDPFFRAGLGIDPH